MKRQGFGELENAIISLFLKRKEFLSVREIYTSLGKERAYTTILTVISRLYQKGILNRKKVGRSFVYELKKSKENTLFSKIKKLLLSTSPTQLFSYFLENQNEISPEELEKIEEMIEDYKRRNT